eukprot:6190569-Pleurochrysis_carterae.AAC.1
MNRAVAFARTHMHASVWPYGDRCRSGGLTPLTLPLTVCAGVVVWLPSLYHLPTAPLQRFAPVGLALEPGRDSSHDALSSEPARTCSALLPVPPTHPTSRPQRPFFRIQRLALQHAAAVALVRQVGTAVSFAVNDLVKDELQRNSKRSEERR